MKVTDPWKRLLAAVAAGGMYVSGAAHAANLNTNLVVNPGFENVDFGQPTFGAYDAPQILDWTSALRGYGLLARLEHKQRPAVPDYANGGPLAGGGSFVFHSQRLPPPLISTAAGQFYQDVDVSTGPSGTLIATRQCRL